MPCMKACRSDCKVVSDNQSCSELKWFPLLPKLSLLLPGKSLFHWVSLPEKSALGARFVESQETPSTSGIALRGIRSFLRKSSCEVTYPGSSAHLSLVLQKLPPVALKLFPRCPRKV